MSDEERQVIGQDVESVLPDHVMAKVAECSMPRRIGKTTAMLTEVASNALGGSDREILVVVADFHEAKRISEAFIEMTGAKRVRDDLVHYEGARVYFQPVRTEGDRSAGMQGRTGPRYIDHFAMERELLRLCRKVMG